MARKESKIKRCIKAPLRAIGKAKSLYVRTMNSFAGQFYCSAGVAGYPSSQVIGLPRNFSVNSSSARYEDGDFVELLRVASARSIGNMIEVESIRRQQSRSGNMTFGEGKVDRNQNFDIGKIDEDRTCEFDHVDIYVKKKTAGLFTRSRSCIYQY